MELLVSGAGPAGVATAIGLVRCGLDVVLLTGARPRPWLEVVQDADHFFGVGLAAIGKSLKTWLGAE